MQALNLHEIRYFLYYVLLSVIHKQSKNFGLICPSEQLLPAHFVAIKLNFNFKVCPRPGNLSPSDDLLLWTAVKVLVEQMIKSRKRRPRKRKLLATRGTRHVRHGHRLGKLAPLSFLAKGKFDVKLCELSLFSVHRQTDTLSCLAELSLTGCGKRHAACGMRHAAFTNWNAAASVEKVNEANRKPQTAGRTAEGPCS